MSLENHSPDCTCGCNDIVCSQCKRLAYLDMELNGTEECEYGGNFVPRWSLEY
jgi:hypothetical protein